MSTGHTRRGSCIETAHAGKALEPPESGDLHTVIGTAAGALVAVIDGLGHGPEAAAAARLAASALEGVAAVPFAEVLRGCHEALRGTRGVVMSVASFDVDAGSLSWVGVGNVECLLLRGDDIVSAIVPAGGLVGHRLPSVRVACVPLLPGDKLVMVTDGVCRGFLAGMDPAESPRELVDGILRRHCRGSDDALVFCARYLGVAP